MSIPREIRVSVEFNCPMDSSDDDSDATYIDNSEDDTFFDFFDGDESEYELDTESNEHSDESETDIEQSFTEEISDDQSSTSTHVMEDVETVDNDNESVVISSEDEDSQAASAEVADVIELPDTIEASDTSDEEPPEILEEIETNVDNSPSQNETDNNVNIIDDPNKVLEDKTKHPSVSQGEKRSLDDSVVDDGMTCSICLDAFTNSGPHRLSSLRCGHLFGHSCVERWLKVGCSTGSKRCPTCNKKATLRDIRILYAKKLVAVDSSEMEKYKEQLNQALLSKDVLNLEIQVCKLNQDILQKELDGLKKELLIAKSKATDISNEISNSQNSRGIASFPILELVKIFDVCDIGGCRVLAHDSRTTLVVSTQSKNRLFPGYGLKKFSVLNFQPGQIVPLHSKAIRDMAFHRTDKDILLTASLDTTAKIFDLRCNTFLSTFNGGSSLWSCCWDAGNTNLFYLGTQAGTISQFDTRNVEQHVKTWADSDNTPVASLASIPGVRSSNNQTGVLACRLNSLWGYEQSSHDSWLRPFVLPVTGPFMSMSYDEKSQLILTSSRPTNRFPYSQHVLNQFDGNFSYLNEIHSIKGSSAASVLSRSCFVNDPSIKTQFMSAFNQSAKKLEVFNTSSGELTSSVPITELVIDICPIYINRSTVLAALTDKKLIVYKFNPHDSVVV